MSKLERGGELVRLVEGSVGLAGSAGSVESGDQG
eukprot:CAMPEP_0119475886 /NCGR_PEP_ID=MMETSP1344-20130328/6621_1 /TAXON_ID=236787 /ORGANISM="Florenciella parvula, Strain CCMP2471" /LENGTH=33 /DNA_ID= /DNA_START= /DNA_END= /DNA_ORIENTATION=